MSGKPTKHWEAYAPTKEMPWDRRRVVHLHRRAGFAATRGEVDRDLADGPAKSIDRVLAGKARRDGVAEDFEETAEALAEAAGTAGRLKAWWVYRMYFGPDPLAEKLTLFWHDHFATSNAKVNDLAAMRQQNETFRKLGRGTFGELLGAAVRDPALLTWLDAPANRKGHPNENLSRELMEVFSLGVGHFTEKDVKEGARALTGWTVVRGQFQEDADRHDDGEKVLLGKKGRWKGADFVRFVLDHPATAGRLAARLCGLFLGEGAVTADAIKSLAEGLRQRKLDVGWAVETILRSRIFFSAGNLRSRLAGPVELVVGTARALEMFDPPPGTLLLADWAARLGQDLFYPPNVFGWPGGRAWVTPRTMIGRANFAAALVAGELCRDRKGLDVLGLMKRHKRGDDLASVFAFAGELLCGEAPGKEWQKRLTAALGAGAKATAANARRAVALVLASPEAQLC